ncbi:Hypothetical protein NTJ_04692 [Nesidiocoris tenuis]|uniref:Uncharacterized protein n=1 Tax=Nesidiocoris tenuis TaxID=355587 RepID=A0ABN7AHZ6_9HEMI|nr:Hypothetical protein NTJ_04692 [Nesidiocoris tenuis]
MSLFSISLLVLFHIGISSAADCVVWNDKTDELVAFSNQQTLEKPTIRLHDHAARLPIFLWLHVDVKTTEGTLGNRNTLSRRLDAIKCDDSKNNNLTLSSIFEYKDLELDLGKVEAKFLFFIETVAKIHLRIDGNSFRVSISKKDNTVCSLNWLDVQELQDYDVHVESNNWWNGWFMSPLLSHGITHYNKEFLMNVITEQIEELFQPFVDAFCN